MIEYVKKNGGISYSEQVMQRYIDEAHAILKEFPDSPSKTAMYQLVDYVIHRKK